MVIEVAQKYGFKTVTNDELEWDLYWNDGAFNADKLTSMAPFQKLNHYPGTMNLARKNNLGRNLSRMKKIFPEDYKFSPATWLLPTELNDFKHQFNWKKAKTFIIKPENLCQGQGIFLTRRLEDIDLEERYVAQRYLHRPYLIDDLKFDLRIYVLMYGVDPLRIFMHDLGLARFATEEYQYPNHTNIKDLYMHLTNYAINKNSDKFIYNEDAEDADTGHKRSLQSIWRHIDENGGDSEKVIKEIENCIVKTIISVQPTLAHIYKSCQPNDVENISCFEILG